MQYIKLRKIWRYVGLYAKEIWKQVTMASLFTKSMKGYQYLYIYTYIHIYTLYLKIGSCTLSYSGL